VAAVAAFAGCVVLEKFHSVIAFRAFYIKDCAGLPILGVLPWAFHGDLPFFMRVYPIESFITLT
jgi:hypothetical protein